MEEAAAKAAEAVACMVTDGVDLAMNRFNTPRKKKKKTAASSEGGTEKAEPGEQGDNRPASGPVPADAGGEKLQ